MIQEKNAGIAFLENAVKHPENVAIMSETGNITYGQLRAVSVNIALHMQKHNVNNHSTIAVQSDDLVVILATLFASSLLGCRWTRINAPLMTKHKDELTHLFQTANPNEKIIEGATLIDATWAVPPQGVDKNFKASFSGYQNVTDPWLIAQTSGTTGAPKFLEVSHEVMFKRAVSSIDDFVPFETLSVCLFPITAFPYITRAIAALVNNCTIVQSYNPSFWIKSGVNLVTASPNQITDIFAEISIKNKIKCLHVGGAKLPDTVALELLENFEQVVDLYGSTETNRVFKNHKSVDDKGNVVTNPQKIDSQVQIVDGDDIEVAAGEEGVVRVRNDYTVTGYLDSPEAQAASFRNGWFYPGDIGYWADNGELVIVGRTNDQFNIGGVKINAVNIDTVILSVDGIKEAMCFMMPKNNGVSELVAFVTLEPGANKITCTDAANLACEKTVGKAGVPKKILFARELPRNAIGKPDRRACVTLVSSKLYL